ncbi:MAG: hypothetical protein IJV67_06450 [Clostridia bacterium]|nr:hypothetical protein [Clostridia bacterium]
MKAVKRVCLFLACIMSMLIFGSCSSGGNTNSSSSSGNKPVEEKNEPLPTDKAYSVLFIGNSYTKRYEMANKLFEPMAQAAGYAIQVTAIVNGGHTLEEFANPNDAYGSKVAKELSEENYGKYDYVVLQEQSLRPITETGKFYDGVRALNEKIRAAGATPVLYATWARKTGSSDLADLKMTNESMTWTLAAIYTAIGEELDIPVAYVGLAFYDAYTNLTSVEIYDTDLYHPVYTGSYLIAATIFAKIFNYDPTDIDFVGTLSKTTAKSLRVIAKNAVFNTPEIPAEYHTSSEGVTGGTGEVQYTRNLTELPDSDLISVLTGGTYPNGKSFSGILGSKNKIASPEYSGEGLTAEQKADIADIGYGVSVIGVEKMDSSSKGYTTAIENLVNGHWGSTLMCNITFDDATYDVSGKASAEGKYRSLITLNFGRLCQFDAVGFASGSMNGFPGAADVYVSLDGEIWTLVPSACWNKIDGKAINPVSDAKTLADPWNGNTTEAICLFDMGEVEGVYVRIGVIHGRNDKTTMYNTINTREILVFGK